MSGGVTGDSTPGGLQGMAALSGRDAVIIGAARTPFARLLGGLKDFSAAALGGRAIEAALGRAGVLSLIHI